MRKSVDVVVTEETAPSHDGRDYGKVFRLTEMSAFEAEKWNARATLALTPRLSREISPEFAAELEDDPGRVSMGRLFSLLGGVNFPELEPLLEELMKCVQVVPNLSDPRIVRPLNVGGSEDIEEVETIHYLRQEVLALHSGFTLAAMILDLMAAVSKISTSETTQTFLSASA